MKDKIALAIARRLPRIIIYWATVWLWADVSRAEAKKQVGEITVFEALESWRTKKPPIPIQVVA